MPDARLFHRKLEGSEKVTSLSDFEFRVWTSYVLNADEFGVLLNHPMALQQPNRYLALQKERPVRRALDRLLAVGLVQGFEHERRGYLYQWDWQDWQQIIWPRRTLLPRPPEDGCSTHTRWLLSHYPGGKRLRSWMAPDGWQPSSIKSETQSDISSRIQFRSSSDIQSSISSHPQSAVPLAVSRKPLAVSRGERARDGAPSPPPLRPTAGSKRPVFTGNRLTVFEWQLHTLLQVLGPYADEFGLDVWLDTLDRETAVVLPAAREQRWAWLQQQLVDEAQRRGLPLATAAVSSGRDARLKAVERELLGDAR